MLYLMLNVISGLNENILNSDFPEERKKYKEKYICNDLSPFLSRMKGYYIKLGGLPYFIRTNEKVLNVNTIYRM